MGVRRIITFDDRLRYSLSPLERVLCPFKKHRVATSGNVCCVITGIRA
jgi:hypothetical protein